jgi:hypothetical protein
VPCGCQQNRWSPDGDLVPAEVGPNAAGYFYGAAEESDEPDAELVSAPKWSPESGTED